jgi:hypothetical protein
MLLCWSGSTTESLTVVLGCRWAFYAIVRAIWSIMPCQQHVRLENIPREDAIFALGDCIHQPSALSKAQCYQQANLMHLQVEG